MKKRTKKRRFDYGDRVVVTDPKLGVGSWLGQVYSQYKNPGRERVICVRLDAGPELGFLARYVNHLFIECDRKKVLER